ncbi:MAG: DNA topoisomerase I [Coriobacteriales bacterium]|jgi:DNA topoisomerase-1
MELIITEKNDAARQISRLLATGKPKEDKVYNTPVYRFERDGHECVAIGLRGHILGVDFPDELVYSKQRGWVGLDANGEVIPAPDVPDTLATPPWEKKRKPFTAEGVSLKSWKIPALPYLTYAPLIKVPAEKDIIRSLKNLAKKADSIVIGTDFDREGELIGLDAVSMVREVNPDAPISRARYSAFVKKEIEEAFSKEGLTELDYDLAHAGESRQYIDLIWGAVLTRYLTLVRYSGFGNVRSSGRVQTPTLALVVDREKEREAFVPEDYWVITGTAAPQENADDAFDVTHATARFKEEDAANAVMERIKDAKTATVTGIEKKRRTSRPPAPFNTTSLMAAASSIGIKPARCMRIAESLYMQGLTSYPRVDNTVYPAGLDFRGTLKTLAQVPTLREGAEKLLKKGEFHPTRGKQQDTDHPPIYPTGAGDPDKLRADEWKLYNLIARRFMATLSDPAIIEGTKVTLDVAGEPFNARGNVIVVPGYRSVYQYGMKKDEQMPALSEGQVLDFSDAKCTHKQTEPPARYSSGKLIQEMEAHGLGTKATRHDMIERLYNRRYIVNDPIEPTQLGFAVIEALRSYAPPITTPDMTAELEDEMTQIAQGKRERDEVVLHSRKLLGGIMDELIPAKDQVSDAISEAVIADSRVGTCPKCGGDLCVKSSAKTHSSFVGCNNWPDCDVTYPLPKGKYDAVEEACPVCGGPQIKVTPFRAKAYTHCLDPECPTNKMEDLDVGECPTCKAAGREGRLIAQKNPRTLKRFIRCTNYDECGVSYPLPQRGELKATGEVCDECGAPEVIVETSRGPWRICVNMDCPKREKQKKKSTRSRGKKSGGTRKKSTRKSGSRSKASAKPSK